MIFDNYTDVDLDAFQILIVGSGPAGLSLALELEKNNIKSVVIEAGGYDYSDESQEYYKGTHNNNIISDISESRLRQFGGTSSIWGGWCKPLNKQDYDNWDFNFKKLQNYQKEACNILDIKNSFRESEFDENFNQIEFQYSTVRFAEKYLNHIKKSKNIFLFLNTQLSHFEGSNGNISHAVCFNQKKKINFKNKHYVLCCGGIENSRILLWTKKNNQNLFKKDLPLGKFWMTHYWTLAGVGLIDKNKFAQFMGSNFLDYDGSIHIGSTSSSKNLEKPLDIAAYFTPEDDINFVKEVVKDIMCLAPELGKKIAKSFLNKSLKCGNIFMHLESEANEKNSIDLDFNSRDKNNIPRVKIDYKISPQANKSAKRFLQNLALIFQKNDLGRLGMNKEIFNGQNFTNLGSFHHMGGTRIGTSPNDSVVDNDLKVHDINNLFVSGSSIFKHSGYKNPTFSIIQFSLRLANKIKSITKV